MIFIIIASIFAGIGTYIFRKGDLINIVNSLINLSMPNVELASYTFIGIILNLIAIGFWQSSTKSNLNYSIALSLYLSLTLITGIIISSIFEKSQLGINFYFGTSLIISGIVILFGDTKLFFTVSRTKTYLGVCPPPKRKYTYFLVAN